MSYEVWLFCSTFINVTYYQYALLLGGGLGGTRRGGPEVNVKHSGREEPRPEDRYL